MKIQLTRALLAVAVVLGTTLTPAVSQIIGSDDYQSYTSLSYGSNGGTGLGAHTYLEGTGGGIYLETGGAAIDGGKSMGIFSSTGGQALTRTTSPGAFGIYSGSLRFNVNNSVSFSGVNLKSSLGTTFGTDELIAFGMTPGTGNNSIGVFAGTNTSINLGSEVRGAVIDYQLTFNSLNSTYTLGVKFRSNSNFTFVSGSLKDTNGGSSGTGNATFLGFANFNTGSNQNLIVDNLLIVPEPATFAFVAGGLGFIILGRRKRS